MPSGIVGRSPVPLQTIAHRYTTEPGTKRKGPDSEHCALIAFFVLRTQPLPGIMAAQEPLRLCQPCRPPLHGRPTTPPPHYASPALRGPGTMRRGHFSPGSLRRGRVSAGRPFRGGRQGSCRASWRLLRRHYARQGPAPCRGPKKAVSGPLDTIETTQTVPGFGWGWLGSLASHRRPRPI